MRDTRKDTVDRYEVQGGELEVGSLARGAAKHPRGPGSLASSRIEFIDEDPSRPSTSDLLY